MLCVGEPDSRVADRFLVAVIRPWTVTVLGVVTTGFGLPVPACVDVVAPKGLGIGNDSALFVFREAEVSKTRTGVSPPSEEVSPYGGLDFGFAFGLDFGFD